MFCKIKLHDMRVAVFTDRAGARAYWLLITKLTKNKRRTPPQGNGIIPRPRQKLPNSDNFFYASGTGNNKEIRKITKNAANLCYNPDMPALRNIAPAPAAATPKAAPANTRAETHEEKVARHAKVADEIAHQFKGALQMLADYDRGLIDRNGNPVKKNGG